MLGGPGMVLGDLVNLDGPNKATQGPRVTATTNKTHGEAGGAEAFENGLGVPGRRWWRLELAAGSTEQAAATAALKISRPSPNHGAWGSCGGNEDGQLRVWSQWWMASELEEAAQRELGEEEAWPERSGWVGWIPMEIW